ncbi:MAG: hypothetical protein K9K76_11760 [Halanaerobiales bacterium]|nr:hypothetical protein [Halanaerobiales bacterium]
MYILKEDGKEFGRCNTKFEADNAKRDREKLNEITGKNHNVKIEKDQP